MKKLLLFSFALLFTAAIQSQTIVGFTVDPAAPSTTDFVKVYVDVMFGNSGCDVDNQGHFTSGAETDAYAHHCQGMLTMVCTTTDTFNVGFLPAGAHVFRFTLTSGFGGPPCTPGIIPDGVDSVNFMVTTATGIPDLAFNGSQVLLYPNPMSTSARLLIDPSISIKNAELNIINVLGKTLRSIRNIQGHEVKIEREGMAKGIYFYELRENNKVIKTGKFIVE